VRMARHRDIDRFNRWASTYDRHWMQRLIFGRVQELTLQLAALEVARPTAILDVGCGTGRLLRSAAVRFPGARLVGVDAAIEMVKQAEASIPAGTAIEFQQATAEQLPFPNAQFDLVFSTVTFHHWRDQRKGIAEVARVLAPGGRWLLADFIAAGLMRYVRRLLRLRQFPERGDVDGMLAAVGLGVVGERRVPGLGGQVTVLAIGAKT
jgi:ubiquinone/menaquinone biosynthesis C-methylase UbiE